MKLWLAAPAVAVLAMALHRIVSPPSLSADLRGQFAIVTGGGRGLGRGIAGALVEAGATVYITGRNRDSLTESCALAAQSTGQCIPKVVDNSNDTGLELFFSEVSRETGGRLDILVNNAYSGIGYWGKHELIGKPFWEVPMQLFDEVFDVGVRSHYKVLS